MSFEPGAVAPIGTIPLSEPEFRGNEWTYLKECLDSGWVSSAGPFVDLFERMVAGYVDAGDGVAIVEDGVAAGDRVVTAGQYRLQPGARVAVNSPAAEG